MPLFQMRVMAGMFSSTQFTSQSNWAHQLMKKGAGMAQ